MQRMEERHLTPVDRMVSAVDSLLRGIAAQPGPPHRPNPGAAVPDAELSGAERLEAARLMRVNHAGEIAAQGLYQGHAAAARSEQTARHMRQAANEELDHLGWCEERLRELGHEPSRLARAWFAGAWLIGAASGALGDRWSLGFVEETERQVSEHLGGHLDRLPAADARSRAILEHMRMEEERHGADARRAGARPLPLPIRRLMRMSAKVMTRTAYWI